MLKNDNSINAPDAPDAVTAATFASWVACQPLVCDDAIKKVHRVSQIVRAYLSQAIDDRCCTCL